MFFTYDNFSQTFGPTDFFWDPQTMQEEFFEPKNYTCDFFSDPLIIDMIYFLDQQTTRAQPTTVRKIALFIPQKKLIQQKNINT